MKLSAVLITLNEEKRILDCLRSLPKGAEIVVLDSGSTDRTVELAQGFGAKVAVRAFDNYAAQKNAAVALATGDWVLSIDADEVLTPELRDAIARVIDSKSDVSGYSISRRLVFMGRELRHGKSSDSPLRLFRREVGRFEGDIHERVALSSGSVGHLSQVMHHYSYDDLSDYLTRFNRYTTKVAENHFRQGTRVPSLLRHALRPWYEFVSRYFFRLGFLDGYPGYTYALLSSIYTYMKYEKLREKCLSK